MSWRKMQNAGERKYNAIQLRGGTRLGGADSIWLLRYKITNKYLFELGEDSRFHNISKHQVHTQVFFLWRSAAEKFPFVSQHAGCTNSHAVRHISKNSMYNTLDAVKKQPNILPAVHFLTHVENQNIFSIKTLQKLPFQLLNIMCLYLMLLKLGKGKQVNDCLSGSLRKSRCISQPCNQHLSMIEN